MLFWPSQGNKAFVAQIRKQTRQDLGLVVHILPSSYRCAGVRAMAELITAYQMKAPPF